MRQGAPGSFTVTASGSPAPTISESGSLPPGVTFSDNGDGTGSLTGTPTASGSFPVTFTANNGVGVDATQSFTLTVYQVATLTGASPALLAAGSSGTVVLTGSGLEPGASVAFTGPTTTVTAVRSSVVAAGTTLSATVKASASTPTGTYTVTVTNADRSTASCTSCLVIIAGPTLAAFSPPTAARGTTGPVSLSGTGFATGAMVKGPSGVRFTNVVVTSSATITATMIVSETATPGAGLRVTVTNSPAAGYGHVTMSVLTIT